MIAYCRIEKTSGGDYSAGAGFATGAASEGVAVGKKRKVSDMGQSAALTAGEKRPGSKKRGDDVDAATQEGASSSSKKKGK